MIIYLLTTQQNKFYLRMAGVITADMKNIIFIFICTISIVVAKPNLGGRIVGGEIARGGQFPYVAAIYRVTSTGSFFCSGVLLSNLWIVTAAQCAEGATSFRIQIGSNTLEGTDANRVTVATSSFFLFPTFNNVTLEHDIALIKLRLPITFNTYITSINLPTSFTPDYTTVTTVGWGQRDDYNTGLSNELRFVTLSTIRNDECQLTYGSQITNEMVCAAGNYNEGLCNGDMGGALVQTTGTSSVLVGVAIFRSQGGCENSDPSGYVRTVPYIEWFTSIMNENI